MAQIFHIEGICGSGKTFSASALSDLFQKKGLSSVWYLEESKQHPIRPEYVRNHPKDETYPLALLQAWREFLNQPRSTYQFLEGYAFQSTVRFLFEHLIPPVDIEDYFAKWCEMAGEEQVLIYLQVEDVPQHMDSALPIKGPDWIEKVSAYIAGTPYGRQRNLSGVSGLTFFWAQYQDVCLGLLEKADIHRLLLPALSHEWSAEDVTTLVAGDLARLGDSTGC